MNRWIGIGRLTKDPELAYTPSGVATTNFTLAVERPFKNAQGEKEADFIRIVTWKALAETVANYLKKGRLTAVEGRLQIRTFKNNEGKKVYMTEVVADNVRFLESSKSQEQQTEPQKDTDPFANDGKPIDINDDDLPFN